MVELLTISWASTSCSVVRDRGKDAMETNDNDLGRLTHTLELDHGADDLPLSRVKTLQDHHDFDEMQEYLDFGSQGGTCRISPLQPAGQHKTSQPRKPGLGSEATRKVLKPPKTPASWPWPPLLPLIDQTISLKCVFACVYAYLYPCSPS